MGRASGNSKREAVVDGLENEEIGVEKEEGRGFVERERGGGIEKA